MDSTMETMRPRAFEPGMAPSVGTGTRQPGWDLATERRSDDGRTLARGLGWFSIGLGLAELAAAGRMCDYFGMEDREELVRFYGLRELASGIGILSQRTPTAWVWGRVAGDVLDLATLAADVGRSRRGGRVLGAMAAVAGVAVLDVICGRQLSATRH